MSGALGWVRRFIQELHRRRVIRVAVVYAGTAFVILQLGEILVEPFALGNWVLRLILLLLILGFPLAIGLAWTFDLTEEGLIRTETEREAVRELRPEGKPLTSNQVIIGLLIVVIGLLLYPRLTGPGQEPIPQERQASLAVPKDTAAARLGPKSVAVLPFTYLAADDSTDYFSMGMTDELLTRLSQIEDLSVIARTSVMQYRGTEKTIPEIGRELGVAHVVEGGVQKAGGKIRVQIQLVDATTGVHTWAESYTRQMENVLKLQDQLARRVARKLQATLQPREKEQLSERRAVSSTAYALYLQGRKLRFQETTESLREAVRLLRRSVSIDSTFAPAWAVLSTAAWLGEAMGGELPQGLDGDSLARRAARRALVLDSTSAEVQVAMGIVQQLDGDYPAAGVHFKRATELNPGLANAQREYGLYFMRIGRFGTAARYLQKAARLDPASSLVFRDLGKNNLYRGNYEHAKRQLKKALALQSDSTWAQQLLWEAYVAQDSAEVARRMFARAIETDSVRWKLAKLGAYSRTGRHDLAQRVAGWVRENTGASYLKSVAYAHLGQPEKAISLLRETEYFEGLHDHSVKIDPLLKPLWDEPSFQRELERLGLDEATVQKTIDELSPDPPDVKPDPFNEESEAGL